MNYHELKIRYPQASEAFLRRNAIAPVDQCAEIDRDQTMDRNMALHIRPTTDEGNLNQTEKAYLTWLRFQGHKWIGVQCITLKLGHDCRYTPDFWFLDNAGMTAVDVKGGHVWEDSLIKLRVVARLYPWIRFVKATQKGELWEHKEFKP